jgi:hypothetical protein
MLRQPSEGECPAARVETQVLIRRSPFCPAAARAFW